MCIKKENILFFFQKTFSFVLYLKPRHRAASIIEYALLVGLIGGVLMLAIFQMGTATKAVFCRVAQELIQITGGSSSACDIATHITVTPLEKTWNYSDLTPQIFTITNMSGHTSTLTETALVPPTAPFVIDSTACTPPLAVETSCPLSVTPTGAEGTGTLSVTYSNGQTLSIPLTTNENPLVTVTPSNKTWAYNDLTPQVFTISNPNPHTPATLTFSLGTGQDSSFILNTTACPGPLEAGSACTITVTPQTAVSDKSGEMSVGFGGTTPLTIPLTINPLPSGSYGIGDNVSAQIGGDGTDQNRWVQIGTDQDWKTVAAGLYHAYAIKNDGTIWGIGSNEFGQTGGTGGNKNTWTQIENDTDWVSVAAGSHHGYALKSNGTLWSIGRNQYNQTGGTDSSNKTVWTRMGTDTDWKFVASGAFSGYAIKNGSTLATNDGSIWGIGRNVHGQIGGTDQANKPEWTRIEAATDWVSVTGGVYFAYALKSGGTVWGIGSNIAENTTADTLAGQTGGTSIIKKTVWTQIGTDTWKAVSAGGYHGYGIKTDGSLWGIGDNSYAQISPDKINKTDWTRIGSSSDWTFIAAGRYHSYAIKSDGTIWGIGLNGDGQIGGTGNKNTLTQIGDAAGWKSVYTRGWNGYALR